MRKADPISASAVAGEETEFVRRFWKSAFVTYAMIEIVILLLQYLITWQHCKSCVMPPPFYFINWLQHVLFTGTLWGFLNRFYHLGLWRLLLLNVAAFLAYYFFWIASSYGILNSGQSWLVQQNGPPLPLSDVVYGSWSDVGKFVLKLTAFYVLKFYAEYKKTESQRIQLALLNKDLQLNLLKQQLNPHFYFNTLNNLYGLARSNSTKLSEALRQLYSIMQYVIVDCNRSKVLLSHEVNFLQSYIALEKLRYEKNTVIQMSVEGAPDGKTIVPLLLIQFVENAFKHGMKEKSDRNWVRVNLCIGDSELIYTVDNSLYETVSSGGIGLHSVRHILNLQYENKHAISMAHRDHRFSVTLKLNLL